MITSLKIDGVEYVDYILDDKPIELTCQYENSINSPVCSQFKCSLDNRSKLHKSIVSNSDALDKTIECELIDDGILKFTGDLDTNEIPIDFEGEDLQININGIDKRIGERLAEFDITQLYYQVIELIPISQRGGRHFDDPLVAWAPELLYHYKYPQLINDLIEKIYKDLGYTESQISINFNDMAYRKYIYNNVKYGNIKELIRTSKVISQIPNYEMWQSIDFNKPNREGTYDSLLKDFAKISGSLFFYDQLNNKMIFHARNLANWGTTVNIDDNLLDGKLKGKYIKSYDGLKISFNDITLLYRKAKNGISEALGIDDGKFTVITNEYGDTIKVEDVGYSVGDMEFDKSIVLNNPLDISIDGTLYDFYSIALSLSDFIRSVKTGYSTVLTQYRQVEGILNGKYYAPFNGIINGETVSVLKSKIDYVKEETRFWVDY